MTTQTEQQFLDALDKKLWNADEYKCGALLSIFLKYLSVAFDVRRAESEKQFRNPKHEYYLSVGKTPMHSASSNKLLWLFHESS